MSTNTETRSKRKLNGVVVADKSEKTIVVDVLRRYKHDKYSKQVYKTKKHHAHDETGVAKLGDKVTIIESRPYSKLKRWELLSVN
jgi:small subunit ribosomal protein S17